MANSECRWECPEQWSEWSEWLAAGLHARNRWRLAGAAGRDAVCQRPSHRHHLAAGGRCQRRLPGLLLLPRQRRTQEQIDRDPAGNPGPADAAAARARAVGDRRFADQAVRPESRRGRRPSQPDAGPGRPAVSVRSCLGHDLAGAAASPVGAAGVAAAGDAVRSPADDGDDSQSRVVGIASPPSCNWRPGWSSGSFRS